MAPEQIEGRKIDARSDIFSFGVVLYEMLTNHMPFRGDYEAAVIFSIVNDDFQPVQEYRTDVPSELLHIVNRSLEKDPNDRYQSMDDMLIDLRRLKRNTSKITETFPAKRAESEKPVEKLSQNKKNLLIGVGILVVLSIIIYGIFFLTPKNAKIDTLAILPFINTTGDPDTEYLSDGIPESIISSLQKIPDLRVASFNSVLYRYKNKEYDPSVVGDELNVASVAMGRLTLLGDNVSINIEIIDTRDNSIILAKQYIENLANLFKIQTKIARDITNNLQLELTGKEQHTLSASNPTNADAYNDYLRGRHFMYKRNPEDFRKAIAYFKASIEKDPNYALAYAGLADTYRLQEQYGGIPAYRTKLQAYKAAEKALALDSLSAESQTSMGGALLTANKYSQAKRRFEKAIQINPNYLLAYHWLGIAFSQLGETSEEIKTYENALELDPMSPIIAGNLANTYAFAGQIEKAINLHKKNINLFPEQATAFLAYSRTLRHMGKVDESIEMMEKAFNLDSLSFWTNINISILYLQAGDYEKSIKHCEKMMSQNADFSGGALIVLGMNYRALGDQTKAVASYQEAIKLDPLATEPHDFLGEYYIKIGDYENALKQFKKNVELSPDDPAVFLSYALTLSTIGKYQEAVNQIKHAVAIDPTWNDYLGLIYYFSRDPDQAMSIFYKAIQLYPKNIYPEFYLAVVLYSREDYKDCALHFNRYLELSEFPNQDKIYSESFPDNNFTRSTLQGYLSRVGDKIISNKIPGITMTHHAAIFAMSGNRKKMMEYLEKARKEVISDVHIWLTASIFDAYHSDPEFISFFKKLNLDKYHKLN